ncbi:MAG: GntR family transcriptional regulator [Acholeplasmataceae bacterium]|nr:GntR family transcriptional regulator [Acholeplasmataceae bacterium]
MYEKVPKYYILKRELIQMINSEELLEDQMIPSERKLIEQYGMSRITVRRAINDLVNEGYLYIIQGKGTFVKGDKAQQDLFSITSCTQDIINFGMVPSRKVLGVSVIKAFAKKSRQLEIEPGEKIIEIDRVYFADQEPINHTIAYLPTKYFPKLENHDFEKQSLYEVLEKEYGVQITHATRTIEAVLAQGETADLLEIEEGVPIILFRGTTYAVIGNKEVPIETFKCHYRSDKFKFYIKQVR